MKICCFGSLNIDYVYNVDRFVTAGETIYSHARKVVCGGKGLNQSIALAHGGAKVFHAGNVGIADGSILVNTLQLHGVDTSLVAQQNEASGHTIIQVTPEGENCIILDSGANHMVTPEQIHDVISCFNSGDYMVLQNEVNHLRDIIIAASEAGMKIVLNPSPIEGIREACPIELIDYLFVNEIEVMQLSQQNTIEAGVQALQEMNGKMVIICTLGSKGAMVFNGKDVISIDSLKVKAVDTTAAGDTFLGFFIGNLSAEHDLASSLEVANAAAALCVQTAGASTSIPSRDDVSTFLKTYSGV